MHGALQVSTTFCCVMSEHCSRVLSHYTNNNKKASLFQVFVMHVAGVPCSHHTNFWQHHMPIGIYCSEKDNQLQGQDENFYAICWLFWCRCFSAFILFWLYPQPINKVDSRDFQRSKLIIRKPSTSQPSHPNIVSSKHYRKQRILRKRRCTLLLTYNIGQV